MTLGPAQRRKGRFLNPDGSRGGQTFRNLVRMIREGGGTPWPERIENTPYPRPEPGPGEVAITNIGHATFLIRTPEVTLLTDPIWSARCSPVGWAGPRRVRDPGLAWEALPRIDAVLLSHAHYDHMDRPTLQRLHRRDAPFIATGLGNRARLARWGIAGATELDWGQSTTLPGGAVATFTPARHFAARTPFDHSRSLWGGFALELPGGFRLCFVGDTAWGSHLSVIGETLGPFDAALIPIGAYEPLWFMQAVHITPEQAVEAQQALRARTAIAMHHGVFKLTQEPIDEPVLRLQKSKKTADFRNLDVGETLLLRRGT